jgi:hypothetical protein
MNILPMSFWPDPKTGLYLTAIESTICIPVEVSIMFPYNCMVNLNSSIGFDFSESKA